MGDCNGYTPGQCTAGACEWAGWIPSYLGDGGDWAANAAARGYAVTMVPTLGSVVCYCRGDGYSEFGHVAGVEAVYGPDSFEVREMNYVGPFIWDDRVSSMWDVCGFILPPGVSPGDTGGGGRGSGPQGWPSGAWDVIAAYDRVRWYFNVTAGQQIQSAAGTVSFGYSI